jgi:hypothetical protein
MYKGSENFHYGVLDPKNLLAVTDLGKLVCLFVPPFHDFHAADSFTHGSSRPTPHNYFLFFECFHCITQQVSHLAASTHLQIQYHYRSYRALQNKTNKLHE